MIASAEEHLLGGGFVIFRENAGTKKSLLHSD